MGFKAVRGWCSWDKAILFLYCCGVAIVQIALENNTDAVWKIIYLLFGPAMIAAYFTKNERLKGGFAAGAGLLIFVGGVVNHFPMDNVEESFIVIPLLFLALYPGRVWGMVSAFLLLIPFFLGYESNEFSELVEDASELIAIASFASVMSYYQQRTQRLMLGYRTESRRDYLTHLENRLSYSAALRDLEKLPAAERGSYVLLLIDVDDFKRINDLLGHSYGDLLLKHLGQRLEGLEAGRPFRIGGDEFAILLQESFAVDAKHLAERVKGCALHPYKLLNRTINISVSIGIAKFSAETGSTAELVRDADLALYKAKSLGKNNYVFFEKGLLESRLMTDRIACDLGLAIEEGQFFLLYQPKVDMTNGQIVGAEALIRWSHPELGFIPPDKFIKTAETTRQIIPIGQWVLEQTCKQMAEWKAAGIPMTVSINVSAIQLEYDDMQQNIVDALERFNLDPELLQIEITETSIMDNIDAIVPVLEKLRQKGVRVAVDDFGVAYSSLSQLSRLPLSVLKIDKSFVDNCHVGQRDRMLARAIIQLAQNLEMDLVAEGVELEEQKEVLQAEGCSIAQGYLFYRPLKPEELRKAAERAKSEADKAS